MIGYSQKKRQGWESALAYLVFKLDSDVQTL